MTTVCLHGDLKSFGTEFHFESSRPAEIIRALCTFVKGFRQRIHQGEWAVIADGKSINRQELSFPIAKETLHIYPKMSGSGPVVALIAGAALIGGSFTTALAGITIVGSITLASIAFNLGVSLLFAGLAGLLAPKTDIQTSERPDERPSFIFTNVVNMTEQGGSVPLAYGRCLTGSVVISAGISTEDVATSANPQSPYKSENFRGQITNPGIVASEPSQQDLADNNSTPLETWDVHYS